MGSDDNVRLSKNCGDLLGYFIFIKMRRARVGALRMDDVDDFEAETQ